jgi:hypothetical protein
MPRKGLKNLTVVEALHDRVKKIAESKGETIQEFTEEVFEAALAQEAPVQ